MKASATINGRNRVFPVNDIAEVMGMLLMYAVTLDAIIENVTFYK